MQRPFHQPAHRFQAFVPPRDLDGVDDRLELEGERARSQAYTLQRMPGRCQHPTIDDGKELHRAGDGVVPPGTQGDALEVPEEGVRTILDERDAEPITETSQLRDCGLGKSEEMGDDERPRTLRHETLDVLEIHVEVLPNAEVDRFGSDPEDRLDHGAAMVGRNQDFVPFPGLG